MKYKKGDIVIVKFPFFLKEGHEVQKGRPALVINDTNINKRYDDVILTAITSQGPSEIMEMELILESNESTGLAKRSLLRLDFIMTIPEELISRKIGVISEQVMKIVDDKLKRLFGIKM
jgi:mRNA-degrading endonuclease toxin of MazEF toxin-antitoxin module